MEEDRGKAQCLGRGQGFAAHCREGLDDVIRRSWRKARVYSDTAKHVRVGLAEDGSHGTTVGQTGDEARLRRDPVGRRGRRCKVRQEGRFTARPTLSYGRNQFSQRDVLWPEACSG